MNGSQTTGQPSSMPNRSRTASRSSSVVPGVMRSTIELGKRPSSSTHAPSSGSRSRANAVRRLPRELAVALEVVARHHREGREAPLPAAAQRLRDQAERRLRRGAGLEVGGHLGALGVELAGDVVDVVAALGDRQRHDPRRLGGHLLDHGLGVVGREQVLDDRADDARFVGAVAVLEHQRVEAVLRVEHLLHAAVARHHPDAADGPVERLALLHEAVVVHGLVRAVEAADAEVDDAHREGAAVIARHRDAIGGGQGVRAQRRHGGTVPTGAPPHPSRG